MNLNVAVTTTSTKRITSNACGVNLMKINQINKYSSKISNTTYNGSMPEKRRFVKYSLLIGFIQRTTSINGSTKLTFSKICNNLFP